MNIQMRSAMTLAAAVGAALVLLSLIDGLTHEKIRQAQQDWLLQNLSSVLPAGPFDQNPIDSQRQHVAPELGGTEPVLMYTAYQNGKPAAAILELATMDGYSGQIRLLLGLNPDGSIVAVRTIEHKETPGLGDGIEHRKSPWIDQFENNTVLSTDASQWRVKKEGGQFDGLTGATITSSAVVQAIHKAVNWYMQNRDLVFNSDSRP